MKHLKKLLAAAMLAGFLGTSGAAVSGCAYGGVAASGEWVVVTKNDGFLFGLLRKVYVCKITPQGVQTCMTAESP
jgi:hypothetical protein